MWGGLQKYKVREGLMKVGQMQERERENGHKKGKNKGKNKGKEEVTEAGNKLIYTGVITCALFS
jgi:flagellar biosynthesis/type III secretory pathway protein FliH